MTLEGFRRAAGSLLRRVGVIDERQGRLFGDEGQALIEAPSLDETLRADRDAAAGDHADGDHADGDRSPATNALGSDAGQAYRHPQATRQLRLAGHDVAYAFVRARRRSIGMVVGPEGLSVRAPRWVSLREVEAALHERAAWIVEHLAGQRERAARARDHDAQWCDGGTLRVLGVPVKLVLDASIRGCVPSWGGASGDALDAAPVQTGGVPPVQTVGVPPVQTVGVPPVGATLRVNPVDAAGGRPPTRRASTFRDTVEAWLQAQAALLFAQRCAHFAPRLGVQVRRIGLSGARTRWGSAGVDGSIRLNWRLMHHAMDCVDYVVVHELAHLRHMNHGPAFWRLVECVVPDHRALRKRLRDDAHSE
jgi:predicted metal-dependent hydrolase